jgi:hypothetical protein
MAGHESPRTTKLYDRTKDEITLSEVERIRLLKFVSNSALRADPPPRVLALLRILLLRAFSFEHGLDFKRLGATDFMALSPRERQPLSRDASICLKR